MQVITSIELPTSRCAPNHIYRFCLFQRCDDLCVFGHKIVRGGRKFEQKILFSAEVDLAYNYQQKIDQTLESYHKGCYGNLSIIDWPFKRQVLMESYFIGGARLNYHRTDK